MVERLNEELRRRDKVIRIYPNAESALRLMGAQLLEHDEAWMSVGRAYLEMEEYEAWRLQAPLNPKGGREEIEAAAE